MTLKRISFKTQRMSCLRAADLSESLPWSKRDHEQKDYDDEHHKIPDYNHLSSLAAWQYQSIYVIHCYTLYPPKLGLILSE